ncbi:uncharacterized protein LOC142624231 [Castanea sativa]|uniref:uncharacterized protein LOC142624231 n=1 Tax=Castanea sativa TaxID=21020 RepID=UPI003F64E10D
MVWAYTPKGNFTVNSAYKVAIASSPNATMEGASTNDMTGRFWQTVWSLGIPTKLKTFAWRASYNILPTKHMGNDLIELIITIVWCMWYNSNKARLGSTRQTCHELIHKARSILDEFQLAHLAQPLFKEKADARWIPPSDPWYKANVDAALFPDLHTIGIGVIIRDHEGSVVVALSKHLPLSLGLLEAEAKAADEAISVAWDLGDREVIFETDSKVVSDALCGTITPRVTIVDIIEGTLHRLLAFRRTQFQHVRRTANQAAHTLARHAKGISEFVTWIEKSPPFLDSLVSREAM